MTPKKVSSRRMSFLKSIGSDFSSYNRMRRRIKPVSRKRVPLNDSNPFEGLSKAEFKKYKS